MLLQALPVLIGEITRNLLRQFHLHIQLLFHKMHRLFYRRK